ncbi:MAG: glutamate racemase [Anaplasmataceae bacterium]|nr:glutamate racemase [Anaplasmataceae bacterium]
MKNANHFIGVFDSGFGGLTILSGIAKELPEYDYLYLGDTARAPYGVRSQEAVYRFTRQAVSFLFSSGADLILLACNTASSESLRRLQQEYLPQNYPDKKILGVLIPAAEEVVEVIHGRRVGVLATEGTVRSGAFERELKKLDPEIAVIQEACPLLVSLVEAGEQHSEAVQSILEDYLRPMMSEKIDTLVLGCTHYSILEDKIRKIIGDEVKIVSEVRAVPPRLRDYLNRHEEFAKDLSRGGQRIFMTTGESEKFDRVGGEFFGQPIKSEAIHLME